MVDDLSTTVCFCGLPFEGHPKCEACKVLLGEKHYFQPVEFREKTLCRLCVRRWEKTDEKLGRPARF